MSATAGRSTSRPYLVAKRIAVESGLLPFEGARSSMSGPSRCYSAGVQACEFMRLCEHEGED